ncbi:MAG: universal stress protein [Rhizobiaceae bacterium]|nr:universal stress protein [Rhizobiaceae bacterium]
MIKAIAHPTDFSPEGKSAFVHALGIALANKCRLDLLHVRQGGETEHFEKFPHVREVLERWGVLAVGTKVEDIAAEAEIAVRKVEIRDADPVDGLARFLSSHKADLIVMATHGQTGLNRWLAGAVSAELAHETNVATLLVGPRARPFVVQDAGAINLRHVLMPIASSPPPGAAMKAFSEFASGMTEGLDCIHVGQQAPTTSDPDGHAVPVRRVDGKVIDVILAEAETADLIVMPTAGRQGFLDALRGSTSEQVVARATCPVLAVPTQA